MRRARLALLVCLATLGACEQSERDLILAVSSSKTFHSSSLEKAAYVVHTEADVPHIYAATRHDAAYVLGFVTARDRFFMMDLARRLGEGRLSELLGSAGLSTDLQSRTTGIAFTANQMATQIGGVLSDHVNAYIDGVNDYIAQVQSGALEPPSELTIAAPFLGATNPADLMKPFTVGDIAAIVTVTVWQSSFDDSDIRRATLAEELPTAFAGAPDAALREAGLQLDLWSQVTPLYPISSAPGIGTSYGAHPEDTSYGGTVPRSSVLPPVSSALLRRLEPALEAMQVRFHRDRVSGFGSNAWAVAGYATADGNALIAGDGHLSLAIPSLLYQFGLDTQLFGDGDLHQLGLTIPGFPLMAIGTNGDVGWSQTQLGEDITDWYREVIRLDAHGEPVATQFNGQWMALQKLVETYQVASVPFLGSTGGSQTIARYLTFDGRYLADFEGTPVMLGQTLPAGQSLEYGLSGFVAPGDVDGDGVVTAVSFSYAGLYATQLLGSTDALGHSHTIEDFRQGTKGLVGYSQNFAVADRGGDILYTSYQPVPCRMNLPRNPDGSFVAGADPSLLLDGTKYGGWRIPIANGIVDETAGATDEQACVVPFDQIPQSVDPDTGYVVTANNDPGGLSLDGSIYDDGIYLGGPWDEGFRAHAISGKLAAQVAAHTASIAGMAAVQADHESPLGLLFVPSILQAIAHAKAPGASPADARLAALYADDAGAYDEIAQRLSAWRSDAYRAQSGVVTFYQHPTPTDVADSVATMIFNTWTRSFFARVFGDEGIDDELGFLGSEVETTVLVRMLAGRDGAQPRPASYDPVRGESVFFDDVRTPSILETSDEDILLALEDSLAFLRSSPTGAVGGFGTNDMSQWLWGLRHQVTFQSLIADFLTPAQAQQLSIITSQLQISTSVLPLVTSTPTLPANDPRAALTWFPRDGDEFTVDPANPGFSGDTFTYGTGPVMRMVFEMAPDGVRGQNIMPGGQSGLTDSAHYADQARLWLGNQAYPIHFAPSQVSDNATGRETFLPNGL